MHARARARSNRRHGIVVARGDHVQKVNDELCRKNARDNQQGGDTRARMYGDYTWGFFSEYPPSARVTRNDVLTIVYLRIDDKTGGDVCITDGYRRQRKKLAA